MKKHNRRPIRGSRLVRGAGGGEDPPPQQHIPSEAADSLRSKAYLRVLDLISEGEIEGLIDGAKSIYLEETVLENDDGTRNFAGVTYDGRTGTQDQTYLAGFDDVENEVSVNVEARYGTNGIDGAVIREITDPNVDKVRIRFSIPALTTTDTSSGDITGNSVAVAVDVQESGGSYVEKATRTVVGKASSAYEFQLDVALTGNAPWNVRVRRTSRDSTSSYSVNKTYVSSITEVVEAKLRYPNSAIIGIRLDAQQFRSVPNRAYEIKGLKVKIPSNYNPTTRAYSGSWDGTFSVAWTDNPAWVFYDLLTNERYGLGAFVSESQVDKWELYTIAQYCDEIIPDGFGGFEPRFTCNLCIADSAEAYTVLQNLASIFRGMVYWASGSVTAVQDSPQDPVHLFTPANVVDGRFTYQGASAKARHSVALVSWNDPDDFYRQKVEYVEDPAAVARYGIQQTQIVAFGCTSRGQAHRLGKWLLYTEQNESETVTFSTGVEGIVGRPGQIIKITDPSRAGARLGGRLSAGATTTQATIDQDVTGSISGNTLSVILPSGAVEERTVIGHSGRVLYVQPAFSSAPAAQAIWVMKSADVEPQWFRVIGVKEETDGRYTVTALRHDPDKFDFVEQDVQLEAKSYTNLREAPDAPLNIVITESLYQTTTEVKAKVSVSWDRVDRATGYVVRYRVDDGNFVELTESQFHEAEILDAQPGTYTIQVAAVNAVGKRSVVSEKIATIFGKTAPPVDVSSFSMIPNQGMAYLSWDKATDLDVIVGGQVRIRWTPRTSAQAWSDAIDIVPALPGNATTAVAPLLAGTYMAKFLDSSGNYSSGESLIVTTVPSGLALNVVQTVTESPTFPGTKTNMQVAPSLGALCLSSSRSFDNYPSIDGIGDWDFSGDIVPYGTYNFQNTIDLGGVWPTRISSTIDLRSYALGNIIDSRFTLMDTWDDIDGALVADVNATLYVRTTEDNPSGSPTWTDWKRIHAGEYQARGFQFYLEATSESSDHNLRIVNLQVVLDLEDRALNLQGLTSGVGTTYRVNYAEPFYATPSVTITANALATGDYFTITNESATGFDIVFKNSAGTTVSRQFNVLAKGYGRKVA